jgi:hypothetical protein
MAELGPTIATESRIVYDFLLHPCESPRRTASTELDDATPSR